MPAENAQKHQWLARTFAPLILVGGSEVAKREVAFLTGLSLACLFQPFNGDVVHRLSDRLTPRASDPSPATPKEPLSADSLSEDDEGFTAEQLDPTGAGLQGAAKVPPVSLQLRVECTSTSGSSSTKSNAAASAPVKRRSRTFCVRFMNVEEAEAISCLAVESLGARSLLLASPSVSELREQMHSKLPPNGATVSLGNPASLARKGALLGVELPWFNEWRRVIFEGSRFSPHETLSQPVGLILVVSTRDPDPVAALEDLLQPNNMPQMCRQYILDPNPVRAVILLDVHPDAYALRMKAALLRDPQRRGEDSANGLLAAACGPPASAGEGAAPADKASARSKEVMAQLCAVFPPANCHLLTLGRGCADARHLQLLSAIRHLYAQSLSFCFHQSLSGNLVPTLLTSPSPAHAQPSSAAETGAPNPQQLQQAEDILCSELRLPVAARLTATTASPTSPAKGLPQQQQQTQQQQQHQHQAPHQQLAGSGSSLDAACLACSFCVGLAWQDLLWLGAFVRHFVSVAVTGWANQRIRQLDGSISSNRKGFRNQLRYLWRKPKAVATATTPSAAAEAVAGFAAAAEEAGGAAEAILSAVGGALLGDSNRSLVSGAASNGTPSDAVETQANGAGTPASPSSTPSVGYVLHAIEWQYRLLGDLCLFFGQTENALQSYRSCATDFKQDKRWVHLGGAYEMCAVALHATGGPRREVASYIEQAYSAYVKAGMGRLALRCVLLGHRLLMDGSSSSSTSSSSSSGTSSSSSSSTSTSSFLQLPHVLHLPLMIGGGARASDVSADVARRLIAANAELPSLDAAMWQQQQQQQEQGVSAIQAQSQAIRSAMLLEQAAVCLEQAGPSHWRKRNFQLVMAGHTYYKAGYKRFALRCYLHVFEGYESGGWHHVAQHLRFIMARQTFSLHLLEESILHFLGLLNGIAMLHECRLLAGCGGAGLPFIPPERQSHYVREFLFVCRVLLERQRLAMQGPGGATTKALAERPPNTGSAGALPASQKEDSCFVALNAELRVPVIQLRDSLGLFKDSVGVYLVGDALLPEEPTDPFDPELSSSSSFGTSLQLPLTRVAAASAVPSYEALGRLISGAASAGGLQELRVQEKLWDRLFTSYLSNANPAGVAGSTEAESLRRRTAVGLPVTVELSVVNPLDLRIEVNNVRLFGDLVPFPASPYSCTSPCASSQDAALAAQNLQKDSLFSRGGGQVEFSTVNVELEPTASATIRLTAIPLGPGRLCLRGVVGELFGLVQVSQHFCLHGSRRSERRFDLRHSHLDLVSEEETQEAGSGEPADSGPCLLQQRLSLIRQLLSSSQNSELKAQLARPLRGLPLFYALNVEGFRMLHAGSPIQVCRWDSRDRMVETHKPDLRLELEVAEDVVLLRCRFVGWPTPQPPLHAPLEPLEAPSGTRRKSEGRGELAAPPPLLPGAAAVSHDRAAAFEEQLCCAAGGPSISAEVKGGNPGQRKAPWMLAGEQRECCLLVRNASSCLALGGLTVAVHPQDIVSITSAALFTEKEAAAAENKASQAQQQQHSISREDSQSLPSGGLPLRVIIAQPTGSSSKRMTQGDEDARSGSVRLFSVLRACADASGASSAAAVQKDEASSSLVPPGMTACLRLSVRAAYAGIHRVRFCLKGQPVQQPAPKGAATTQTPPVWRAVEALLVVAPSLELCIQPRLSWTDPSNILFLCRVTNHSTYSMRVLGLSARGLPSLQKRQQQLQEDEAAQEGAVALSSSTLREVHQTAGEECSAAVVPLVSYRGTAREDSSYGNAHTSMNTQSNHAILEPKDEMLLLFAPQDAQRLRRLAEASDNQIQVTLRWALCNAAGGNLRGSASFSTSEVSAYEKRTGAIQPAKPISLEISSQGIPLELTVSPSPATCQRFIKWTADEPCTFEVVFKVRNLSKSQHLRLRLRADSHPRALAVQADDTRESASSEGSLLPGKIPQREGAGERRGWNRGHNGEKDADPVTVLLSPLCMPTVLAKEDEQFPQQQKLVLPDCCYNYDIAARLGDRIISCDGLAIANAARLASSTEEHAGLPSSHTSSADHAGDSRTASLPSAKQEVGLQPTGTFTEKPVHGDPQQPQSTPTSPPSHVDLAREAQQPAEAADEWALVCQPSQQDAPITPSDGCCFWLGKVNHDVGVLPPGGSARAAFTAFFPSPGVYNLNTVKAQVEFVADDASHDAGQRRLFGGPAKRLGLQGRHREAVASATSASQQAKGECVASDAAVCVAFPLDFLVHVVPGDDRA
ncbi:hypothetical protein Esti_005153 [Eimeria stiedai]